MSTAVGPERMRISVERYLKMVATGVLTEDDRVELVDGDILNMPPIGPPHSSVVTLLTKTLVLGAGDSALVAPAGSVPLGNFSMPEPDLMLLKPRVDAYRSRYPDSTELLLLVEVSDSSLAFDQGVKRALYARHGIPEYWVVDIPHARLHRYLEPTRDGWYGQRTTFAPGDTVAPQALPAVQVAVGPLFS
jgi:Uma2 family endonuclease